MIVLILEIIIGAVLLSYALEYRGLVMKLILLCVGLFIIFLIWAYSTYISHPYKDSLPVSNSSNVTQTANSTSYTNNLSQKTETSQTDTSQAADLPQFPKGKCVVEYGVKICDLSYSIKTVYGDGTRKANFEANAIDCVNVATGAQKQGQGNTIQVDNGNTYCISDLGAVYIDPTIQVSKYYDKIEKNSSSYYIPNEYSTCIWTYNGGSGDVPYIKASNNVGPENDFYSVKAFCKNGDNRVDIYSYKEN